MRIPILLFAWAALMLAQTPAPKAAPAKAFTPPKTPWGDPDLQGLWPAKVNIPMQRPASFGDRATLTDEEVNQRMEAARRQAATDSETKAPTDGSVTINPPGYWQERGAVNRQASLVVDPPNGRMPPLTARAQQAVKDLRGGKGPGDHFPKVVDSWDDFDIYSRCITRGVVSSMLPTLYNFGNEIVQSPGFVVIRNEMIHESRIIPIGSKPHASSKIRSYMGDSRGHWEGNTLVIETVNVKDQPGVAGGLFSEQAKLTERITRTGSEDLSYDLTVEDPLTWTKPWSLHMPLKMDNSYPVYEYACHEGNYMMLDSLMGARELEKQGKSTRVDRGDAGGPPPRTQP